mgnify:CR=1 FL=1
MRTRTGTWNQASKNRNRTWFFMSELYVDSNGAHADYPHFSESPRKNLQGRAQAESLRKGEQPLHETEKENSQTPCSYCTSAERLSAQGIQKDNQFLWSCVHRIFEHERNEPGFKVWKEFHDNVWGMFTDFLSYKLERAGKKMVRIDKWYPSSKICSCCGKLKKDLKLEDRMYSCTCGNQMNRDENAAINICREGLRISGVELDTERKISWFPPKRRFCSGLRRYETVPFIITEPWDTRG